MNEEEFTEQLKNWKNELQTEVVSHYENENEERGNVAYRRWKERFISFLKKYNASEASRFIETTTNHFLVGQFGEHPFHTFMRENGKACFAFIDDLIDVVSKGHVKVTESTANEVASEKKSLMQNQPDQRNVFVVHGRNYKIRDSMFQFLRSLDLSPIEWEQAIKATGKASPYIGEILNAGFSMAQAAIILFTPDDEARLSESLRGDREPQHEIDLTPQPRQNVLFEAGMAIATFPERTLLVEFGHVRPMSDISGIHTVRMDNSTAKRQDLADRLKTAGCSVNLDGRDWHRFGDFSL